MAAWQQEKNSNQYQQPAKNEMLAIEEKMTVAESGRKRKMRNSGNNILAAAIK